MNTPHELDDLASITQLVAIKAMQAADKRRNFVCSPYALTLSLLTLFPYLDVAGRKQIASMLEIKKQFQNFQAFVGLPSEMNQRGTGVYTVANRVWAPPGIQPESAVGKMLTKGAGKLVGEVNLRSNYFAIAEAVESWYQEKLGEIYQSLGPVLDESDLKNFHGFAVTNVSGFSGGWQYKFHNHLIAKADFKTNFGQVILTPTMQRASAFKWDICPQCKTIELNIESRSFLGRLGMIFLSPRYVSLEEFENRLTVDFYRWAVQRIIDVESIFSMPLFSIQSKKTFPQLFGTGVNLDSLDDKSLTSGRLIHKTGIVVNDFGIGTAEKQMPGNTDRTEATLPPAIFFLDSPFTFWLRDQDSGVVLLAGHYASPD